MDKYLKSNLCHIPWSGIEARPNGTYKPCCVYKYTIKDAEGRELTTMNHDIGQAQNSADMDRLRQEFKEGKRPEGCEACWKEEDVGKTSKRQHTWLKSPEIGTVCVSKDVVLPAYLDLKLGNICNLKCRICSPHSSSQMVADWAKLDPDNKDHWQQFNKTGMWPRKSNRLLDTLDDWLPHVRYLEITGGEPLMIQEQFAVLQRCIDLGVAGRIDVHYNTNGTQYPEEAVKHIWPHFKRVELAFSIDDIGKRFEYQRKNAKFDEVDQNIRKFRDSGLKNLSPQVCTTINFFNIMYIDELAKYVEDWAPDYWHINILHWPVEFDVQRLDPVTKKQITEKLQSCELYKKEIAAAIAYLNNTPAHNPDITQLRRTKVVQMDQLRGENFKQIFPALNNLIKIYE